MSVKVDNMIGMARRAGKVESGDASVRAAIEHRKAKLIILAGNTAARTRNIFCVIAGDAKVPLVEYGTKEELGVVLGKSPRSVVAVTDENLAQGIIQAMGIADSDIEKAKYRR